jgi:hypothetical protein
MSVSITSSTLLGAGATAVVQTLMNPPLPYRVYYTCQVNKDNMWSCVKGREVLPYALWVPVCAYTKEQTHHATVAKKIGVPKEFVEMR